MGSGISKLVFQPPDRTYDRDPNLIELHTAKNNVIPAFFVDREQEYTILFSHGNAEDLGMIIEYFKQVAEVLQVNVFAYEYSGYGTSTGSPSEENVLADVEAAFLYLRDIIGVPWERIILYGRSIGSGPSCHLASATPVRGLILQSPVLSAYRVGFNLRFTLPGDMFPNIDKAPKIRAPTYVVHGTHDEIVPIWHGEDLHNALPNPFEPFWVQGGGHNNLEVMAREPFFKRLKEYVFDQDFVYTAS